MNESFFGQNIKEAFTILKEIFMKCDKCKKIDCKHVNVKYHPCCMKMRCEDCGQEWVAKYQEYIPIVYPGIVPYIEPYVQPWVQPHWTDGTGDSINDHDPLLTMNGTDKF